MPLQRQLVPVQFGGGINTKIDPKQLQAGNLLELTNGQFTLANQINKRFGYDLLPNSVEGGGTITAGAAITTFKDELVLFDGQSVYSYLPATGNWANRGTAISVTTLDKSVVRMSNAEQANPDMNSLYGVEVYAWEDTRGGVWYSVLDSTSGATIVAGTQINPVGLQPKVLVFQGLLVVLYCDNGGKLFYQTVNPYNPTLITPATAIATDGWVGATTGGFPYDAAVSPDSLYLVVAYVSVSAGPGVVCLALGSLFMTYASSAGSVVSSASYVGSGFPVPGVGAVSVAFDAYNNICLTAAGAGTFTKTCWTTALIGPSSTFNPLSQGVFGVYSGGGSSLNLVLNGAGPVRIITAVATSVTATSSTFLVFCEVEGSGYLQYETVTFSAATIVGGAVLKVLGLGIASKAWRYSGNTYVNASWDSTLQSTDFTLVISASGAASVVAKVTPDVGGGFATNPMCSETVQMSAGTYKFANLQAGKLVSEDNTLFTLFGVNSTQLDFVSANTFETVTQSNNLLIVGGILQAYDGVAVTELGFHLYPEGVTAVPSGSDGSLSTGTYQYVVTYEWTDRAGQIHRSAPSIPVTCQVTLTNHVLLTVPTLRLTAKSGITIVIYRTGANGTTFNRVTSTIAPLLNDPTVNFVTFTDKLDDITASGNELVYTTGGILSNIAPPASAIITTYGDRVFLTGMSDPLLSWYSQTTVDNSNASTVPTQFCAELTEACDPRGGSIMGFGLINQSLIIFKERSVFALSGNGPDATGGNNDFGDPQLITSDAGCINSNSVVIVPMGLMFQSHKGIYLLDQSLNLTYIGAEVEKYNALTITSAVLCAFDNLVVFATASGLSLVYDYHFKQWSTWTNQYAVDSCLYSNLHTFINARGQVYIQNRTKFTDAGSFVPLSFTLPDLAFAGLNGFQRVFKAFILGAYKGAHSLQVSVAYDYSDAYSQMATVTPTEPTWGGDFNWGASPLWGGAYQIYQHRLDFSTQKCTAVRLKVSDSQTSGYNEGYAISSIAFEVGALPGGNRLPASNVYGVK